MRCLSEEVVRERAEKRTCGKGVIWVSSPVLAWGASLLSSGLVCLTLVITHIQGLHTSGNMPAFSSALSTSENNAYSMPWILPCIASLHRTSAYNLPLYHG